MTTITLDVLHPLLALRLAMSGKARGKQVRWLLRASGWQGSLALVILRLAGAQVTEWFPSMVRPEGGNEWHCVQRRLVEAGLVLGRRFRDNISGGPDLPRSRLSSMLQIQTLSELATAAGLMTMLRDGVAGDEVWLARSRAESLLQSPPWDVPAGLTLKRHALWFPFTVQRKPGYYVGGGQLQLLARSSWLGLATALALSLVGLLWSWRGRGRKGFETHPFAVFLLPNEVGRIVTGFGWLSAFPGAPLGVFPAPGRRAADSLDFSCRGVVGYGFGKDLIHTDPKDWAGYGGQWWQLWCKRGRARLPLALMPWFWHQRLELLRREAFFVAAFQRHGVRLVWMMAQFESLHSTAAAAAILRLGGECWGGCNSLLDGLDSFVFRANANRVLTWGERDAALYRQGGTVEQAEAIGYPDSLEDYRIRSQDLRTQLLGQGFKKIIALYDNNFGSDLMITHENYRDLFQAVRIVLDCFPETAVIIKSKTPDILARGLGEMRRDWEQDARIRFDFERSNLVPAFAADSVIGIMLSGPGVLAAAEGVPVFSLDPAEYAHQSVPPGIAGFSYHVGAADLAAAVIRSLEQPQNRVPVSGAVVTRPGPGDPGVLDRVLDFLS